MFLSKFGAKNMKVVIAHVDQKDLLFISELMAAGQVRPVIDRRYPLSETAEALRYLEDRTCPRKSGHNRGRIKLTQR